MSTLKVEINMDGAAFGENECQAARAVSMVLGRLANTIGNAGAVFDGSHFLIMDINGNSIGHAVVEGDEQEELNEAADSYDEDEDEDCSDAWLDGSDGSWLEMDDETEAFAETLRAEHMIKAQDKMLRKAWHSHREHCEGKPFIGGNFIECPVCKAHAHCTTSTSHLMRHTGEPHSYEEISPEEF
jgi:hypothetical protein